MKRTIIEWFDDKLKNMRKMEHTRHRSVNNFLNKIPAALTAYCFLPKNSSINTEF